MQRAIHLQAQSRAAAIIVALAVALGPPARADVLVDQSAVVTTAVAPDQHALSVTQAAALTVTATDLAFPAAMDAVQLAVTQGGTILATLPAAGSVSFNAAPGQYVIWTVGVPGTAAGAGSVSVSVSDPAAPASQPPLLSYVATFALPGGSALQSQADYPITIPATGDYTFTLADQAFPAPLSSLTAAVFYGSTLLGTVTPGTPTTLTSLTASTPGAASQYKLTVLAAASASPGAGLYGAHASGGPAAAVVLDVSAPVGAVAPAQNVLVPSAGSVTLAVTDLAFPAPLPTLGAALTAGATLIVSEPTAGSRSGAAPAGSLQLWRVAGAGSSAGSYAIAVTEGTTALYGDTEGVSSMTAGGASGFAIPFNLAAAGDYNATITDYQFPAGLQSVSFAVAQGGTVLAQSMATGSVPFTAAGGPATLIVTAQAPAGGSGLFGADITAAAGGAPLLDTTQPVGTAFARIQITDVTAGPYDVTLTDGAWPAAFQTLALAVTRDGQLVGKIYGGGTFSFAASPGTYVASFIATPASGQTAGFYSLKVQSSAPTVTLSADQTSVQSGQGVRLTWSSTGASGCTASGGWSGAEPASGSGVAEGPLSSNTTFTLVCTGPGGTSAPASVSITVTPAPASSGGHGAFGLLDLGALALLILMSGVGRPAAGNAGRSPVAARGRPVRGEKRL